MRRLEGRLNEVNAQLEAERLETNNQKEQVRELIETRL